VTIYAGSLIEIIVGKIEEKRIDKRVKFSDLDNNGKTRELNNKKATYADIAKRKIYA